MISIIIPTWNEAAHLPATLAALDASPEDKEIIVVDAGSDDETATIARAAGCHVIHAKTRQRASQLNTGAAAAGGEILFFLHADTLVQAAAMPRLEGVAGDPRIAGGGFARRFQPWSPLLACTCRLADWRGRFFGLYFGDQALFVRRNVFLELGGFRDLPVFEDWDLCRRLKSRGKMRLLKPPVQSSARRFAKEGALRVTWRDFWLTCRYLRGEDPQQLWKDLQS